MQRLDRLAALLTSLQSGRWKTAEELAQRYAISTRTVYRDIRALQQAGVPVLSEAGRGYSMMEGYRLPPVMFSREEAVALLTGEKLMRKQNSARLRRDYGAAMEKIRAVLRSADKDYVDALDGKLAVYAYPVQPLPPQYDQLFHFLEEALCHRQVVELTYFSPQRGDTNRREVEPLGLLQMGSAWYLAGWCRLRNDYRSFRLDRVSEYRLSGEQLPPDAEHTLEQFVRRYAQQGQGEKAVVRFAADVQRYVGEEKYRRGWVSETAQEDGSLEMVFLLESQEPFARWLLTWGTGVAVLEPAELVAKMAGLAEELHRHYAGQGPPKRKKPSRPGGS